MEPGDTTAPDPRGTSAPSLRNPDAAETRTWLVAPHSSSSASGVGAAQPAAAATAAQLPPQSQSQPAQVTVSDVFRSIKPSDFLTVHQTPCARSGFLVGVGSGTAMFIFRWVLGARAPRAANWAVGTAFAGAIGGYEFCQYQRRAERMRMKRMVEIYQEAVAEQRAKAAALGRGEAGAGKATAEAKARPWYRIW